MSEREPESPLSFPCEFPIKAMGRSALGFEATVREVIARHAPHVREREAQLTESRNGNYLSVTLTITATSRDQLDTIYAELQGHTSVLAAL